MMVREQDIDQGADAEQDGSEENEPGEQVNFKGRLFTVTPDLFKARRPRTMLPTTMANIAQRP